MGNTSPCKIYGRDQITSLTHNTKISSLINILKTGYILSPLEAHNQNIKLEGTMVVDEYGSLDEEFDVSKIGSFPGIYLSVNTIYDRKKSNGKMPENYLSKEVRLVLSKKILDQDNWHFNIIDSNGKISTETLVSKTLYLYPPQDGIEKFYEEKIGSYPGNELVVHDGISVDFINEIQTSTVNDYNNVKKLLISHNLEEYIDLLRCNENRDINRDINIKYKLKLQETRNHIYNHRKPYLMYKLPDITVKLSYILYYHKHKDTLTDTDLLNIYKVYLDYCGLEYNRGETIDDIKHRIDNGNFTNDFLINRYKQNLTVYPPFLDAITPSNRKHIN